jgi:FSR family fosmidomycin resistance protein-like MFS transporter
LITALVTAFGLIGSLGMLIPGLVMAFFLAAALPQFAPEKVSHSGRTSSGLSKTNAWGMTILVLMVALRSWTHIGFTTFVPFYHLDVMKGDPRMVGALLAVFLGSGAAGTLIAGPIADRIGLRQYAVGVFLLSAPLAIGYLFAGGIASYVLLGALGFVLMSTFTVTVVLAQSYMPNNVGMASGLIVGFATGAGGLGVTVLGWVADNWGLPVALWISALMPLSAFVVSLFLPDPDRP